MILEFEVNLRSKLQIILYFLQVFEEKVTCNSNKQKLVAHLPEHICQ
jgi:hypothetical protein